MTTLLSERKTAIAAKRSIPKRCWLAVLGPKLSSKFTPNEHSICVTQIQAGTQHHPAQTTNRVVNKITTGIVTSASMVDTATLAVTSSWATS